MENMLPLFDNSFNKIKSVETDFTRYLYHDIDWNVRLIAIVGARGVGKTTLLLQYIKKNIPLNPEVLYVSLDDFYFANNRLVDLADSFVKNGGQYLFIDEVHKYPGWSVEIKNLYDTYKKLKIVFTGSSALEIFKGQADLSRRAVIYTLHGLSLREYIEFYHHIPLPVISLKDVLVNATELSLNLTDKIKPVKFFNEYLEIGYYPFFKEDKNNYLSRVTQTVNYILETDLPASFGIDFHSVIKLKKLMSIMAAIVPFKPNILQLSNQIGVTRETLLRHLYYLSKAQLINLLGKDTFGMNSLNKPDKIYLNNTNLMYALAGKSLNKGTARETFFYNQLNKGHSVAYSEKGDFLVDNKFLFETGGKNKTQKQIKGEKNVYLALDDIESGYGHTIPLWLFGFLY